MTQRLLAAIRQILDTPAFDARIVEEFRVRAEQGALTRDENPETHFIVYFAAYDPTAGEVFIGHHRKSGLWLFNGGHIDQGETPIETAVREIGEEWGTSLSPESLGAPQLLTITGIASPAKQPCTRHYDIWYFVPLDRAGAEFDPEKLGKEFYETRWADFGQAATLTTDPGTRHALATLRKLCASTR